MAGDWMRSPSFEAFHTHGWRRRPYAESGTAGDCVELLTAETVARLVESGDDLDCMVVRDGMLLSQQQPGSPGDLRELLSDGCSLVLRHAEAHDDGLRDLAEQVGERLDAEVAIQLYVTPVEHHSFGWHYDAEDVLIVQTAGSKEYFLRENTVNPHPTPDTMPRDMQYERETTPAQACPLVAGDWLYVPSGWWHMAKARENSLSISIGVLPR